MTIKKLIPKVINNNLLVEHRVAKRLNKMNNKVYVVVAITAALIIYNIILYLI